MLDSFAGGVYVGFSGRRDPLGHRRLKRTRAVTGEEMRTYIHIVA